MKRVLQIKKRGFNYYRDYTEFYLHNALQKFGYNLTRDEKTADFTVTAYIHFSEKYFHMTSPFFDTIPEEEIFAYTEAISEAMKSEVVFMPYFGELERNGVSVYNFMYSKTSSAYDEPALIETGESLLEIGGSSATLGGGSFGFKVINYGGPSKGLDIIIETSFLSNKFLKIETAQIRRYTKQGMITLPLTFEKEKKRHICRIDDFEIHAGLNKMSALWARTRTKYQSAEFYMDFFITSALPSPDELKLKVEPHHGKGFSVTIE